MRLSSFVLVLIVFFSPSIVLAQPASGVLLFKKYNADIDKYAFTKNFIQSVSYYKRVDDRLKLEGDFKEANGSNVKLIQKYIDDCILDNTELRIARNLLTPYTTSGNGLIRKVSRQAVSAYDGVLALSMKARNMWQAFYRFKSTGKPADFNEDQFTRQMVVISGEKKEKDKILLSASVLLRTVLLSARRCDSEDCKILVLTGHERQKLVGFLDEYARDNMAWGIKAGQSPVEGCVAAIREVLEDKLYISSDEK